MMHPLAKESTENFWKLNLGWILVFIPSIWQFQTTAAASSEGLPKSTATYSSIVGIFKFSDTLDQRFPACIPAQRAQGGIPAHVLDVSEASRQRLGQIIEGGIAPAFQRVQAGQVVIRPCTFRPQFQGFQEALQCRAPAV